MSATYLVAMRDTTGRTLADESVDDYGRAKRRYREHVRTFNGDGFALEVAEIALIRVDDERRRSTLASTRPQTSRAKAQLAMGVGE